MYTHDKRVRRRQAAQEKGELKFQRLSVYANLAIAILVLTVTVIQGYIAWRQSQLSDVMARLELARVHEEFEVTTHGDFRLMEASGRPDLSLPLAVEIYPKKDVGKTYKLNVGAALFLSDEKGREVCAIAIRGLYNGPGQRAVRLVPQAADDLSSLLQKLEKNGLRVEDIEAELFIPHTTLLGAFTISVIDQDGKDLEISSFDPSITPIYIASWAGGTGFYFSEGDSTIEHTCPGFASTVRKSMDAFPLKYGEIIEN